MTKIRGQTRTRIRQIGPSGGGQKTASDLRVKVAKGGPSRGGETIPSYVRAKIPELTLIRGGKGNTSRMLVKIPKISPSRGGKRITSGGQADEDASEDGERETKDVVRCLGGVVSRISGESDHIVHATAFTQPSQKSRLRVAD